MKNAEVWNDTVVSSKISMVINGTEYIQDEQHAHSPRVILMNPPSIFLSAYWAVDLAHGSAVRLKALSRLSGLFSIHNFLCMSDLQRLC